MDIKSANLKLAGGENLTRAEMQSVMAMIMSGGATDAQIGAFLTALHIKGEVRDELTGAAQMMRELAEKVSPRAKKIIDCVGTGGDGAKLFNVSTAAAMVAAAAGLAIAKHGNRAATSHCGSADVLEAAGVNINLTAAQIAKCVDEVGIGFMFAPAHHSATRFVMPARQQIGMRTIFNLLGPLTNPAGAQYQLVGVFSKAWVRSVAEVLGELGSRHALVVSSQDGLDEISIAAPTWVAELKDGGVTEYKIAPGDFGIAESPLAEISVDTPAQSLELMQQALGGGPGAAFDMVAINAGAVLYAGGVCDSLATGVSCAGEILKSGAGLKKLNQLAEYTKQF